jgi:endonuclease/exonuclease/phosphatase family metal-dependent hydrolase
VTFASWNLKNYLHTAGEAPAKKKGDTAPKPAREVEAVTRIIVSLQPDILGVCEMGTAADLTALQTRLREAGLDLPHSEFVQGADTERHLALLSRFPIAGRNPQTKLTYLLDETILPLQRGLLDVTLQITPAYQLRCVGTHLKSRRDVPEADEALMRRNEAHLLRQHADAILADAPETNLLVYGDLNDTRDTPTVKAIAGGRSGATSLTPVAPTDAAGERWTYYFAQSDTYSRIDFLFASRGLNPELDDSACKIYSGADWMQASDHRPLTALIRATDKKVRARKSAPDADRE